MRNWPILSVFSFNLIVLVYQEQRFIDIISKIRTDMIDEA